MFEKVSDKRPDTSFRYRQREVH